MPRNEALRLMLAWTSSLLLVACGYWNSAGGTSTTTNEIALQIEMQDKSPAAFARILVREDNGYFRTETISTHKADSLGMVQLQLDRGNYLLYMVQDTQAAFHRIRVDSNQSISKLLVPANRIAPDSLDLPTQSSISKTLIQGFPMDSIAHNSILYLPDADYYLRASTSTENLTRTVQIKKSQVEPKGNWTSNYLLLDGFEKAGTPSSAPWLGYGLWYGTVNTGSTMQHESSNGLLIQAGELRIDYQLIGSGAFAIAGFSLKRSGIKYSANFESLDSLCFRSPSKGNLTIKLENFSSGHHAKAVIPLNDSLGRYCFQKTHLDSAEILGLVENISFVRLEDSTLVLDSIEIFGIPDTDW